MPSERHSSSVVQVYSRAIPRRSALLFHPEKIERATNLTFAVGGALIALCVVGATWATLRFRQDSRWVAPSSEFQEPVVITAPQPFAGSFSSQPGVQTGQFRQRSVASLPSLSRTQEDDFPTARISAPVVRAPAVSRAAPATVQSVPVVDYAARDREIASLKRQIDDLDERIRVMRVNPNGRYLREGLYSRSPQYGSNQLSFDAYMKRLDAERDELRRQKWKLEGR